MKDNSNNLPDFSENKRLQLVFAYKNDYYYTDSMMRLSLDQYLWLALRQYYNAVWFVSVRKPREAVRVNHFPDDLSHIEKKPIKYFLGTKKAFDWLMDQAKQNDNNQKQAFVMDLDSFVSIFEGRRVSESQKSVLKNHTIVLVMPPEVQETKELLITSNAFDNLEAEFVIALRDENNINEDIYGNLNDKCSDVCLFLQEYTVSRIKRVLMYSLMHHPKRRVSEDILDCMAVYLTQYLNNRSLQWYEEEKLFGDMSRCLILYKDIEEQLSDDIVWKRLENFGKEVRRISTGTAERVMNEYLKRKNISRVMKCIYMVPEPDSIRDYYLNIDPQNHHMDISSISEDLRTSVLEAYEKTYHKAYTSGNCYENNLCPLFLNNVMDQAVNCYDEPDIFFRYLLCIGQCMDWIYYDEDALLELRINTLNDYMLVVLDAFKKMPNWNESMQQSLKGKIQELDRYVSIGLTSGNNVQEMRDKISGLKRLISINTMSAISPGGYPPPVQSSSADNRVSSYPPGYNKNWMKS